MADTAPPPLAVIDPAAPMGMIVLRGAVQDPGVAAAVQAAVGLGVGGDVSHSGALLRGRGTRG